MIFRPENWSFKGLKISTFSKRVSLCFLSKNRFFCSSVFFFFCTFWIKKNDFLTRNWSFKKSKKSTFYKGDNLWFLFKNQTFSNLFFLGENNSAKTFLFDTLDRKKKGIFRPENWRCKKGQKRHFPKGLVNVFFYILERKERERG